MSTKKKGSAAKSAAAAPKKTAKSPGEKGGTGQEPAPAQGPMVSLTVGQVARGQRTVTVPASTTKAAALKANGYGDRLGQKGFAVFSDAEKVTNPDKEKVRAGEVLIVAPQSKDG